MIVYKCDRCGAYYDKMYDRVLYPFKDSKNGRAYQGLSLIKIDGDGTIYGSTKDFMLCQECMSKLVCFLENPEKDEFEKFYTEGNLVVESVAAAQKNKENANDSQTTV